MTQHGRDRELQSLYVIGAGFSRPAGLPLGNELFPLVVSAAHSQGYNAIYHAVEEYIEFLRLCHGKETPKRDIDVEDFIAYLDFEHRLEFMGKDTWSRDGNASQLLIRKMIAFVLSSAQCKHDPSEMELYREFARRLQPGDYILSFNYDTILESVFEELGIDYRLFPSVYKRHGRGLVVEYNSEIVLLKMHGSIDWFHRGNYEEAKDYSDSSNTPLLPCSVFNSGNFQPEPITRGPRFKSDQLLNIYRIDNLNDYFSFPDYMLDTPFILAPSYQKLLYADPLVEFWRDVYNAGIFVERLVYIGYSMPQHDNYVRQAFYRMTRGFFRSTYGNRRNLKLVDFRQTREEIDDFEASYRFIDWDRTDCYLDGFNMEAVEMIFEA